MWHVVNGRLIIQGTINLNRLCRLIRGRKGGKLWYYIPWSGGAKPNQGIFATIACSALPALPSKLKSARGQKVNLTLRAFFGIFVLGGAIGSFRRSLPLCSGCSWLRCSPGACHVPEAHWNQSYIVYYYYLYMRSTIWATPPDTTNC